MTTIFADAHAGVMVCDSRVVSDDGVWFPARKVIRCHGELIGVAGDCKDGDEWLDWHKGGRKGKAPKPKTPDEFSALILRSSGLFSVTEGAHEMKIDRGFHGIGSGGACAIAAYLAIKSRGQDPDPKTCVLIAAEVDSSTGGRVIVHKLKG
jgi:hypothetical protein